MVHTDQKASELLTLVRSLTGDFKVIMEATGVYHLPLLTHFKQAGMFVSVINPLAMKKYASRAIRKGKTDKRLKKNLKVNLKRWPKSLH